jgi:hypothetical protein
LIVEQGDLFQVFITSESMNDSVNSIPKFVLFSAVEISGKQFATFQALTNTPLKTGQDEPIQWIEDAVRAVEGTDFSSAPFCEPTEDGIAINAGGRYVVEFTAQTYSNIVGQSRIASWAVVNGVSIAATYQETTPEMMAQRGSSQMTCVLDLKEGDVLSIAARTDTAERVPELAASQFLKGVTALTITQIGVVLANG